MNEMNTMCSVREMVDGIVTHDLREVGPRYPIRPEIDGIIESAPPSKPVKMLWFVHKQCRLCGDGGQFSQDGKALEYHQMNKIFT